MGPPVSIEHNRGMGPPVSTVSCPGMGPWWGPGCHRVICTVGAAVKTGHYDYFMCTAQVEISSTRSAMGLRRNPLHGRFRLFPHSERGVDCSTSVLSVSFRCIRKGSGSCMRPNMSSGMRPCIKRLYILACKEFDSIPSGSSSWHALLPHAGTSSHALHWQWPAMAC